MFEIIFQYIDHDSFYKYLRLLIIVGMYLMCRNIYSEYAKQSQVKRQIALDEKEKLEKPVKEERERAEKEEALEKDAASFGWGKKTRKNVKLQESILQQESEDLRQRYQSAYDAAEDHDIEDLLED